jgi:hypothetical protein
MYIFDKNGSITSDSCFDRRRKVEETMEKYCKNRKRLL